MCIRDSLFYLILYYDEVTIIHLASLKVAGICLNKRRKLFEAYPSYFDLSKVNNSQDVYKRQDRFAASRMQRITKRYFRL